MRKSIHKRKDGLWSIQTTVEVNGKRHFVRIGKYASKHEADADYARAIGEWKENHSAEYSGETFRSLCERYGAMRKETVREKTFINERSVMKNKMGSLMDLKITAALDGKRIRQWYVDLLADARMSSQQQNYVISVMRALIEYAFNEGELTTLQYRAAKNTVLPLRHAKSSGKTLDERVAWTDEEIERFLNVLPDKTMDKVMFTTLLLSGLRIGELLGLKAGDVDSAKSVLHIVRQANARGEACPLKTEKSERDVWIPKELTAMIQEYVVARGLGSDDWLFPALAIKKSGRNVPISRPALTKRLYMYEEKAGVRKNVPHGLRATNDTQLIKSCKDYQELTQVAKRQGHEVSLALNIYNKIMYDNMDEIMSRSGLKMKKESN